MLWVILWGNRADLLPMWIIILIAFYIGIGLVSFKSVFVDGKKETQKKTTHKKTKHKKKTDKRKKKK